MPAVLVEGAFIVTDSVSARGSAWITLSTTFPNGTLLYTLDGSEPSLAATLYTGPFSVGKTSLLRAIAFNAAFSQWVESDPLTVEILPLLTVTTDGGGTVTIDPPAGDYLSNSLAVVTATPAPGWTFLHWLGDASGSNASAHVTMTRARHVKAVFGSAISTNVVGNGSIVVRPLADFYPHGTEIRLTAVPQAGDYLAFWSGAVTSTRNPLRFVLTNANPVFTAVSTSLGGPQSYALTVLVDGMGEVTVAPQTNRYPRGTNATLRAEPEPAQAFTGWSGDASGTNASLVVTMDTNKVITANFTRRPWLTVGTSLEGLSDQGFRLTLTGEFGAAYRIDGSTDLVQWTPLGTITNTYGTVQFTDPAATNTPHRFYRAVEK
jgi:uncharacterized repeat protein (TIGR02543 family)